MKEISKRISELRKSKNISSNKLSILAGISQSYMRDLELGNNTPTIDVISRICSALGITLADFFAEEKTDIPPDLMQLLREAETLTPEQRAVLTDLIQTFKK